MTFFTLDLLPITHGPFPTNKQKVPFFLMIFFFNCVSAGIRKKQPKEMVL